MFLDYMYGRIFKLLPKPRTEEKATNTLQYNPIIASSITGVKISTGTIMASTITSSNSISDTVPTKITPAQLKLMAPNCDYNTIAPALDSAALEFGIVTNRQIRHWIAHLCVESAHFHSFIENLNYSSAGLMRVWPHRFPDFPSTIPYANHPQALANKVYGGRLGNTAPDDGFIYRGRGFIQLTGKAAYAKAGTALGLDLVGSPDLAATPKVAARIAGWFWQANNLNKIVAPDANEVPTTDMNQEIDMNEKDDLIAGTKAINGGLIGEPERLMELHKASWIWKD